MKTICDCGGKDYQCYLRNAQGFLVVKCSHCGLLRTDPLPKSTISDQIDFENRLNNLGLWKYFACKIILLIKKYKKNKKLRILDIGSNIGIFVELAQKEGWETTGIDIDKRAIEIGNKQFKGDLRATSLEKAGFKNQEFDVIVLLHTLEHIYELRKLLQEIKKIIKKDGILIIQAPNINGLPVKIQKLRGKPWYGYDFSNHLWHFQPETLTCLINKNGFEILDLNTRASLYYESTGIISDAIRNIILKISAILKKADQITLVAAPKK